MMEVKGGRYLHEKLGEYGGVIVHKSIILYKWTGELTVKAQTSRRWKRGH